MNSPKSKVEIVYFPSKITSLRKFERFLKGLKDKYKISDDDFYRIYLTSIEAFTNAIIHGNRLKSEKKVEVKFRVFKKLFEIEVRDEGEGFDPNLLPDPTADENLLKESGRGLYIIKTFSDRLKLYKTKIGMCIKIQIKKSDRAPSA